MRNYQVRFVSCDPNIESDKTFPVESGVDALLTAKDIQDNFVDIGTEDNVPIRWQGIISTMKPWYLDTGHTFVLIEWRDGSKLLMEPVSK